MDSGHRRRGLAVFVLALACRLVVLVPAFGDESRVLVLPDSTEYVRLARNLNAGRGLSLDETAPYRPDVRRTPAYPLLLAAIFRLPGAGRVRHSSESSEQGGSARAAKIQIPPL